MFWSKNKKNRFTPAYPSFAIQKWGSRGYTLHGHVFVMHIQLYRRYARIIEKAAACPSEKTLNPNSKYAEIQFSMVEKTYKSDGTVDIL